jgi:adenosine deaminase
MPKIELHVHLEGATGPETVWAMAQRNRVALPAATLEDWRRMYQFTDFNHFIEIYMLAASAMQTAEDFAFMVEQFLRGQAEQNIRYSEAFLSASLLLKKLPAAELIAAFEAGAAAGEARYHSRVRFIPDFARMQPETRFPVLDFVLQGRERGLFIGLGVGGIEQGFPPEMFKDVYAEARRQGLHVVAHAGETVGPKSVWGALRSLHAERIGHGVRSVDDPALLEHLAHTQTPLEVCPCSNYRLKVTPPDQPHPIRRLVDAGVYVTLNSDDPAMFSTSLNNEYATLAGQGFTWDELWRINCAAIDASFLSQPEKAAYHQEFDAWLAANGPQAGQA